jgi:hypothetical protein
MTQFVYYILILDVFLNNIYKYFDYKNNLLLKITYLIINNLPFVCSQLTTILYSLLIRDLMNSYLRNTKNHRKKAINIP